MESIHSFTLNCQYSSMLKCMVLVWNREGPSKSFVLIPHVSNRKPRPRNGCSSLSLSRKWHSEDLDACPLIPSPENSHCTRFSYGKCPDKRSDLKLCCFIVSASPVFKSTSSVWSLDCSCQRDAHQLKLPRAPRSIFSKTGSWPLNYLHFSSDKIQVY